MRNIISLAVMALSLILVACGEDNPLEPPTPGPTATPTVTPTATATPTAVPPTATPTLVSTSTAVPPTATKGSGPVATLVAIATQFARPTTAPQPTSSSTGDAAPCVAKSIGPWTRRHQPVRVKAPLTYSLWDEGKPGTEWVGFVGNGEINITRPGQVWEWPAQCQGIARASVSDHAQRLKESNPSVTVVIGEPPDW